jgi:hypothetical protein
MYLYWMGVNWVPILTAALINVVLGMIWYSKFAFGDKWSALVKKKRTDKPDPTDFILAFAAAVAMSVILQGVMTATAGGKAINGALIASMLWLGIMVPVFMANYLWENKSLNLIVINGAYWLVSIAIQGALLAAWR